MLSNKTAKEVRIEIKCNEGEVITVSDSTVTANQKVEIKFFIVVEPSKLSAGRNNVNIDFSTDTQIIRRDTISFLAPNKGETP